MLLQLVFKANEVRFLTLRMFVDGHALRCLKRVLKDYSLSQRWQASLASLVGYTSCRAVYVCTLVYIDMVEVASSKNATLESIEQ